MEARVLRYKSILFWEFIERHKDKPLDWYMLSININTTSEIVEKYKDKPWNVSGLVRPHPEPLYSPFEYEYVDEPWYWTLVTDESELTMEIIEKHIDKPWNWDQVGMDCEINEEFIMRHIHKPGCPDWFMYSPYLSLKLTIKYFKPDEYLHVAILSERSGVICELLEIYPNVHWNWSGISQNLSITMDYIEKHINKPWDWKYICRHSFDSELPRLRKLATTAATIETWWFDVRWNPRWKRARERLRGELEGLRNE
jgi:hypothetical protein